MGFVMTDDLSHPRMEYSCTFREGHAECSVAVQDGETFGRAGTRVPRYRAVCQRFHAVHRKTVCPSAAGL